jgi:hypothetical protein
MTTQDPARPGRDERKAAVVADRLVDLCREQPGRPVVHAGSPDH